MPISPKSRLPRLKSRPGLPLHVQAEVRLRELIAEPRFTTGGEMLTDEITLADRWGISRNTLRHAIGRLVAEGRLKRVAGQGTRVLAAPVSSSAASWLSFTREMRERGVVVKNFEVTLETHVPPVDVAADMRLKPGALACLLTRLRGWDGVPAILAESWLSAELAGIDASRFRREPLYSVLQEFSGAAPARSVELVTAPGAPESVAKALRLSPGDPVLLRRRIIFDAKDVPVEVNFNWCRSDRYALTLELRAEG